MSPRRLALAVAGVVSALAVASTPLAASADTGHFIPVRSNVKRSVAPAKYLAEINGAFAAVHRGEDGVTFFVHDPSLPANSQVIYALFNNPTACNPAVGAGKLDPEREVVSWCDPGVDAGNPATGLAVVFGPKVTPDKNGNFELKLDVGQGLILVGKGLQSPRDAEISVVLGSHVHIVLASPNIPGRHLNPPGDVEHTPANLGTHND